MSYYFFIDDIMLPYAPASVVLGTANKNTTISLINEGEVNIIKTPGLSTIAFDARLPNKQYPFASYDDGLGGFTSLLGNFAFKKASYFLEKFEKMKAGKKPVRLVISRRTPAGIMLHNTSMKVTLEEYSVNEDVGEGIDVVCPLVFKQYRKFGTKECEVVENSDGTKTISVKAEREPPDMDTPKILKVAGQLSALEAVKGALNGQGNWKACANAAGLSYPGEIPSKGMVIPIVN